MDCWVLPVAGSTDSRVCLARCGRPRSRNPKLDVAERVTLEVLRMAARLAACSAIAPLLAEDWSPHSSMNQEKRAFFAKTSCIGSSAAWRQGKPPAHRARQRRSAFQFSGMTAITSISMSHCGCPSAETTSPVEILENALEPPADLLIDRLPISW